MTNEFKPLFQYTKEDRELIEGKISYKRFYNSLKKYCRVIALNNCIRELNQVYSYGFEKKNIRIEKSENWTYDGKFICYDWYLKENKVDEICTNELNKKFPKYRFIADEMSFDDIYGYLSYNTEEFCERYGLGEDNDIEEQIEEVVSNLETKLKEIIEIINYYSKQGLKEVACVEVDDERYPNDNDLEMAFNRATTIKSLKHKILFDLEGKYKFMED